MKVRMIFKGMMGGWGMVVLLLVMAGCSGQTDGQGRAPSVVVGQQDSPAVATRAALPLGTATIPSLATAVPTESVPFPTPRPQGATLTGIDLAPILAQADDLPAGFTFASPAAPAPGLAMQFKTEGAIAALDQRFSNRGAPLTTQMFGDAILWAYDPPTNLHDLYAYMTTFIGATEQDEGLLGEYSSRVVSEMSVAHKLELVFVRCQAVVYLEATAPKMLDADLLMTWAQKIDQRIQESPLCDQRPRTSGRSYAEEGAF